MLIIWTIFLNFLFYISIYIYSTLDENRHKHLLTQTERNLLVFTIFLSCFFILFFFSLFVSVLDTCLFLSFNVLD